MENERPKKRHSLLPQRSTSIASNTNISEEPVGKLAPPPKPKQRDISPSKLPVGGLKRGQSVRHNNASTVQTRQQTHQKSSSTSRDDLPTITHVRTTSTAQTPSSRRLVTSSKSHARQLSQSTRPLSSHKRSNSNGETKVSVSTRPDASGPRAQSSAATRVPSKPLANVKIQRPASTAQVRPASPRKVPKAPPVNKFALLTTPLVPAAKPVQDAKVDLLHLHSLHKESAPTKSQWTLSAKDHYEKQFKRLVQIEDDLRGSEMDFLEQQNAASLIDWCREVCAVSGQTKTKALSGNLGEMWLLVSPGGRYTAAVTAFEDWHSMVEKELDHRLHDCNVDIMEGLGDGWKAEVDALMSSLCRMSDNLDNLGPAIEPSDLARCLNVLMTMLANMLEELVLIRDIEGRLVEREGSFVRDRIEGLSTQVST